MARIYFQERFSCRCRRVGASILLQNLYGGIWGVYQYV